MRVKELMDKGLLPRGLRGWTAKTALTIITVLIVMAACEREQVGTRTNGNVRNVPDYPTDAGATGPC